MFRVLTLNLHCYQEENQLEKFALIAIAIFENDIDVVLLQEVAQNKNSPLVQDGQGVKEDNAARIISRELQKLGANYNFAWYWSHYGWEIWEEGLAILSKLPLKDISAKYLTQSSSKNYWLSRIALAAHIEISGDPVKFVTTHTGFWNDKEESYENQIANLLDFAQEQQLVIFGGDFNVEAGTPGYEYIMKNTGFRDLYLESNIDGMFDPTIGGVIDGWPDADGKPKRIDYFFTSSKKILCKKVSRIFTKENYGEVSDHFGLLAEFELLNFN